MSHPLDRGIALAVRLERERLGISQAALAARVREYGHKWSQATVWSIERADRPLRHSEALSLQAAFGFNFDWVAS